MNTTVIICSVNRPPILHATVLGLQNQTVQPECIILSLCDEASVLPESRRLPGVHCVFGPKGLTLQRNTAIPHVQTRYTLYLDDDMELAPDYIQQMEGIFDADSAIAAATGGVAADGAKDGNGIDREAAIRAVLGYGGSRACSAVKITHFYGCNMFVRTEVLRAVRFDEHLPLYGWMEDRDFGWRCQPYGKVIQHHGAVIAHLGTRSGRTSDLRYAYSKIANPWYLWRKSVIHSLPELVVRYWMKTTIANAVRAMLPKRPQGADYKRRLIGNLMAYRDLMACRIDPLNILNLQDSPSAVEKARTEGALRSAPGRPT